MNFSSVLSSNTIIGSFMFFRTLLNNITALGSFKTQLLSSSSLPVLVTARTGSLFCCTKFLVLASGSASCIPCGASSPSASFLSVVTICLPQSIPLGRLISLFILFHYFCRKTFLSWNTHLTRFTKLLYSFFFKAVHTTTVSASSRSSITYCLVNENLKRQKLFATLT